MSGDLGTRAKPLEFHAEQLKFEFRTSDPSNPLPNEMWGRSDLDSGDKVATLRWNESGTPYEEIPAFAPGTSGEDVEEVLPVQTPNGEGYIPTTTQFPAYSQLALQHNGDTLGWHDAIEASEIPDTEVYLHDDFGDGKLQNRDGGGTVTHNGETGVYRPEYTIDGGSPTVTNEQLDLVTDDALHTDINLNLSETITWEFTGFDLSDNGDDTANATWLNLFSETATVAGNLRGYEDGYAIRARTSGNFRLVRVDPSGETDIVTTSSVPDTFDTTITRQPDATWEVFVDGSSIGTGSDSNYTSPQYFGYSAQDTAGTDSLIEEVKVS